MKGVCRARMRGEDGSAGALSSQGLRAILLAGLLAFLVSATMLAPSAALAIGPNAVMYPVGWNTNAVARGDDTSNLVVNLPFAMNWMGTSYSQLYLNMNGNVTFSGSFTSYTPGALTTVGQGVMAPYWADVDSRYVGAPNQMYYSNITSGSVPTVNGHKAFLVTWSNVMRYNGTTQSSDTTDTFQLIVIDRSDTGAGNFDFMFNYDKIVWNLGTASGAAYARAGWATATGENYELPGSGTATGLLDSGAAGTSLIQNSLNSGGQLGRYVWQVRSGSPPNSPPTLSTINKTLEANASGGYNGYNASADASATDADGYIWTLSNDCPATLPFGTTNVNWTATDNWGGVATATESITVQDTTPPSNPTLSSPTHVIGVWSSLPTVTINGAGATDSAKGVTGFSYSWTKGAPGTPDTTVDPASTATASVTATAAVSRVDALPFDLDTFPSGSWPASWTIGATDSAFLRLTNAAGRNHGSFAAEAFNTGATLHTPTFYQDYNLSGMTSATVTWWDNTVLAANTAKVDYSTNGGTTWTTLQSITGTNAWTKRTYTIPVGGTVRVRFSAGTSAVAQYADWDDVAVTAWKTTTTVVSSTVSTISVSTTNAPGDGQWYFNLRTTDAAGNWSSATNFGFVDIDTVKPTTTSNAPSTWATNTVNVSLVATDPSGPIAYTRYKLDAAAVATYTVPIAVSGDGTHTLLFFSADMAGNIESTVTSTIQIDTTKPSTPATISASAVSTTSIEVNWAAATDAVSGIAYYGIYRSGSLVATTASTVFTDTGLTPGSTYPYYVIAYNGAGLAANNSATATATTPAAAIWMSLSTNSVDMGNMNPGQASTLASATTVKVGGVGLVTYDFWCSATDFSNAATSSTTPTMPVNTLSYATSGWISTPLTAFSNVPYKLDTASGVKYVWEHDYGFDYVLTPPWTYDPGTYTTTVTYTVVSR